VNTNGTIEVMLAAARAGVRRVIFAGSSSVYGLATDMPLGEDHATDPQSPYAASKAAAELYLRALGPTLGVETVALRYFNVFGPSQDPASQYAAVVPRFITAALAGDRPVVYGDGQQSRDFVHVANVVSANLLAASAADADGLTANIGGGASYSLLDLLRLLGSVLGRDLDPQHEPARTGDVPRSEADISVARERLGYAVIVPFEEGLRQTVDTYRATAGEPLGR
jgi:nucleoside-diphosphate-sugar epimerase